MPEHIDKYHAPYAPAHCANGIACIEVTCRLQAADLAARSGYRHHANRLRATAEQIALVHLHEAATARTAS